VRVEGVIEERIGRLDEELREALTVASVEGEEFTAEVVARVRDLDERGLVRRLSRELDRQHRLVQARGRERINHHRLSLYRFRHHLFQHYLYHSLDEVEREFLHEDVGSVLEELYGEQATEIAPQLARHFLLAGDKERALPYLMEAGIRSQRAYAHEEALHYLRTALAAAEELGDREEALTVIHEHLGDVLFNIGEYDGALSNYTAALDLLQELPIPDGISKQAAALCRKVGMVYERKGEYSAALEWLTQARERLRDEDGDEMARICAYVAVVLYRQGEAAQALEWCQRCLETAQAAEESEELAHAYILRAMIHGDLGKLDQAISDCSRGLEICQRANDLLQQARAFNSLGAFYYYKGDWEEAIAHYRQSLTLGERIGKVDLIATVSNNLGELYLIQGQFDEAVKCFQKSMETWKRTGFLLGVALSFRNLGQVYARQEEWSAALEHLETSLHMLEDMGSRDWLMAEVYRHLAEVHLSLGQWEMARQFGQQSLDITLSQGIKLVEGSARRTLGQIHRLQGRWEEAEALLQESLKLVEELGLRYERGQALWELALLYRDRAISTGNDTDRAKMAKALGSAIAIFEEMGARWDLARAQALKADAAYCLSEK